MRSTHESNFAQNLGKMNGQRRKAGLNNNTEEFKNLRTPRKAPDTAGGMSKGLGLSGLNDPELERIYGTARGLADITMLSDWEKDS